MKESESVHLQRGSARYTVLGIVLATGVLGLSVWSLSQEFDGEVSDQYGCSRNLKHYGQGVLMYLDDYDDRYPPMIYPSKLESMIHPYVRDPIVFSCPATTQHYLPNPALNFVHSRSLAAPARTVVLRDAIPHVAQDDKPAWNVALANGHVKLTLTEPKLGKPRPTPTIRWGHQQLQFRIQQLRTERRQLNDEIDRLEMQERRMRGRSRNYTR